MSHGNFLPLLAATLFAYLPALAQHKAPTEVQCHDMVNSMLQFMKSAPLKTESDKQGAKVVIDRAEKLVKDNRTRGASECESWAAISKLVATQ